ncbi:MAG TPA: sigma-70 family RNA polymerase sigma factor [Planctomycetota bacterium]|nr:sigma-70 family RNA polymerase sigma factor [Planctomycetota bacterium]
MDRDSLEALVRTHQVEVFTYIHYLGAPRDVAEDLAQETFLVAFRKSLPPDVLDGSGQRAWLRGIARNLFLQYCDRQRASRVRADSESVERAEAVWQGQFLRDGDGLDYIEALRKCLEKLSEEHQRALDLRYAQSKSRMEMAFLLNMTGDGVKSLLRRIRAGLGSCIRKRLQLEVAHE